MATDILIIFMSGALIFIALTAILNVFTMLRLGHATQRTSHYPSLSILIPARNEAEVIGNTISHLLTQDYPAFEIILLDDNSTDGTGDIAKRAADGDQRLKVINGAALPDGWAGKNWACHQLSKHATGQWLIFTDADVLWGQGALMALVDQIACTRADLITVWSTQKTETWGERLVVPLMAFVILGYLPHVAVNRSKHPAFAAANGQCLAFRREAYERMGGHAAIPDAIVEDIQLARKIKQLGMQLRMVDGNGLVQCRMYNGWSEVKDGYAKNIIAGYGDSIAAMLVATLFHWTLFWLPLGWLLYGIAVGDMELALVGGLLVGLGVLIRALTAVTTRQRWQDALLMPLSVALMTVIAAQGVYWYVRYGGPRWKDRTIVRHRKAAG